MEYTLLTKPERDQIVRGFLAAAEADHFRESLNQSNLAAMGADKARLTEQKATVMRAAAAVANMKQQAKELGVDISPPPDVADAEPDVLP